MSERTEARPMPTIEEPKPPVNLDQFLRMVLVSAVAVLILAGGAVGILYLGYQAVLEVFGSEGLRTVMLVLGTALFIIGVAYALGGVRRQDMRDLTGILKVQAMLQMAQERNDDQGEVMRQLAPQLLSLAKQEESSSTQRALAMFYGAMKMQKDNQPAIPDFGMTGASIDESQFRVQDDD